eukprot:TRINITY_DN19157_c0_g1_i1.p1 TRINITY_DN19157_c0_g1~~TRINITY_DN19157_c0_g1_i1.p1  ORF type:complete len:408 (+),score=65.71 TRINITY_DN19157_c0_g1_i1:72-1226(+)
MHAAAVIVVTSFVISLLGLVLNTVCTLPSPYSGLLPVEIPNELLQKMSSFPPDFETGSIRQNTALADKSHRLFDGLVKGSECVSVSPGGTLFMMDRYGYVHSASVNNLETSLKQNITYVGPGRPLGFEAISDNVLLVCDSLKGVLRVTISSEEPTKIEILSNSINYANDLHYDHATETIFYTHSSERGVALDSRNGYYDTMTGSLLNLLHGKPTGSLRKLNLKTMKDDLVRGELFFANGVAVSHDGKFVFVVETFLNRVLKINIETGAEEEFLNKIPAFPDGISLAPDGNLWLSCVTPLSPLKSLLPYPTIRLILSHLLPVVRLFVKSHGLVVKVDASTSDILLVLMDPTGEKVASVSSAVEYKDRLFVGNLNGDYISYVDLKE